MKFIMITHWEKHWDNLEMNNSNYPANHFRDGMDETIFNKVLSKKIETIFIKKNHSTREFEKAWSGTTCSFKKIKNKYQFKVKIENEIECPSKYINKPEGWYCEDDNDDNYVEGYDLDPPFIKILANTSDHKVFEKYTYYLLKIIGIHDLYPYDPSDQRGKADGVFTFERCIFLYDCTLDTNYIHTKETQINNFIAQLKNGPFRIGSTEIILRDKEKFVWIITQNNRSNLIKKHEDVKVIEISIYDLIKIFRKRLKNENFHSEETKNALINIGANKD